MATAATTSSGTASAGDRAGDFAVVRATVGKAATSFYWAMRILPADRRPAMFAIYAFCREVDDIADEPAALDQKKAELDGWRRSIAAMYSGIADRPITRVLIPDLERFSLRRADFMAVIDGMEMDADGPVQAPPSATLDLYCDRVACAVGRLCIGVFGEPTDAGRKVATHLGRALQLTNILRDLDEDAAIGRLYLPAQALQRAGLDATLPPETVILEPAIEDVCREIERDARTAFAAAAAAMADCDPVAMRPARMMQAVYAATLRRLSASGWQPPRGRVSLSKREKLWLALRHGWLQREPLLP